jgi:hypothetical protein
MKIFILTERDGSQVVPTAYRTKTAAKRRLASILTHLGADTDMVREARKAGEFATRSYNLKISETWLER